MGFSKEIFNNSVKKLAILIDPDKIDEKSLELLIEKSNNTKVDYFFVGGSLVSNSVEDLVVKIKNDSDIPVIIFPGNPSQFTEKADAILFLSLISGRNPEYLISNQVISALRIKRSGIEVLSTGYILVENGHTTSVEYMSNTSPIPKNKPEIIVATAVAGELLGMSNIYLEAGSGATESVYSSTVKLVKDNINSTLIVGGGIRSSKQLAEIYKSGADIAVVGTSIEVQPDLLDEFVNTRNSFNL